MYGVVLAFDTLGRETDPSVVLLHGWPLDRRIWSEVARRVALEGFRVLVPDLPGFGESPPIDVVRATVETYAEDVSRFLSAFGPSPAAVAGHSFGGYVALALADRRPEALSGLGLVASRTIPDSEAARRGRAETIEKVRAQGTAALLPGLAEKLLGLKAQAAWRDHATRIIAHARPDGVIAGLAAMAARPDRTEVLRHFPRPVLVVHGTADALIPVHEAPQPARSSGSLSVSILPDVGHMPMWEAPEATAEAVVAWAKAAHAERL